MTWAALALVTVVLGIFVGKVLRMAGEIEKIEAEVRENSDAIDAAVTLIDGLAALIRDNVRDPARLEAIAADLDRASNRLGAAVVANTPADPAAELPPDPPPGEVRRSFHAGS